MTAPRYGYLLSALRSMPAAIWQRGGGSAEAGAARAAGSS